MAFTVIYDACVLWPAPLRDLLLRIAVHRLVQAKWTDKILDECFDPTDLWAGSCSREIARAWSGGVMPEDTV